VFPKKKKVILGGLIQAYHISLALDRSDNLHSSGIDFEAFAVVEIMLSFSVFAPFVVYSLLPLQPEVLALKLSQSMLDHHNRDYGSQKTAGYKRTSSSIHHGCLLLLIHSTASSSLDTVRR
jgi:hypothetical protein